MKKINIVFLGSRDYYQSVLSLIESNRFGCLITDFYTPDLLCKYIRKRRSSFSSTNVISIYPFFLIGLFSKFINHSRINIYIDFLFGFAAALICHFQNRDALVYSYYLRGFHFYLKLTGTNKVRFFIFQVHPTPWFVWSLIKSDADATGITASHEQDGLWSQSQIFSYKIAVAECEHIFVASNISKQSIGIEHSNKVTVIPYGSRFSIKDIDFEKKYNFNKLKILSVGALSYRKGYHYLCKAISRLPSGSYEWHIVSRTIDSALLNLLPKDAHLHNNLSDSDLEALYQECHVFALPSLIEGFGLVYLEASASGCIIVASSNTGIADHIEDSKNGFIVDFSDFNRIARILNSILANEIDLVSMANHSQEIVSQLTWEKFRCSIRNEIEAEYV